MPRPILLIFVFLFLASSVFGLEECQRVQSQADVPCTIISTWNGSPLECSNYTITIYNNTPSNISIVAWQNFPPFCQVTWNITELGTYVYQGDLEDGVITIVADLTFGGVVVFAFLAINLGIFILPFFVKFVQSEIWNRVIGKSIWLLGLMFLALNTTLIADLAISASLGVESIIWTYHWFFVRGIYIGALVLLVQTVLSAIKEWGESSRLRRMGD